MIPIKATPQVVAAPAIFQTLSPNLRSVFHSLRFGPTRTENRRGAQGIACSKESESRSSEELLAAELGREIKRYKNEIAQREDAFRKSKELLFVEVSDFAGLKSEELSSKWRRMDEAEKWVLVKGFVAEWSAHFHPLSARSVKELVEEYVNQSPDSASATFFSDFTKLFGFNRDG